MRLEHTLNIQPLNTQPPSSPSPSPSTTTTNQNVYSSILSDLRQLGPSLTAQQHAQVVAAHAQRALFEGALAATIASGVRALYVPDMHTEKLEYAKNIMVGYSGWMGWLLHRVVNACF